MKKYKLAIFLAVLSQFTLNLYSQNRAKDNINELLTHLTEGNKRFAESKSNHPNQSPNRIKETAKVQNPFAIILACSDSRVPPEIIFDRGIGDLFVVRSAGNLVDDIGLGSIEYAVEHLGTRLIVVLGHERCGAVDAAVKGGEAPGHIESLLKKIKPAVEEAKKAKGDLLENSVLANVRKIVGQLESSEPILKELVSKKKIEIVGARYDLDNGVVTILK